MKTSNFLNSNQFYRKCLHVLDYLARDFHEITHIVKAHSRERFSTKTLERAKENFDKMRIGETAIYEGTQKFEPKEDILHVVFDGFDFFKSALATFAVGVLLVNRDGVQAFIANPITGDRVVLYGGEKCLANNYELRFLVSETKIDPFGSVYYRLINSFMGRMKAGSFPKGDPILESFIKLGAKNLKDTERI